jgi:hypothetical protein
VRPLQDDNGWQTASEVNGQFFSMSLVSVAVGKAAVDDTTVRTRRAMRLDVRKRIKKV